MASGPQTIIRKLSHKLEQRWLPKWYEAFYDADNGGFYERVGENFKPVYTGRRRLLTNCRLLAMFSNHVARRKDKHQKQDQYVKADLEGIYHYITETFAAPGRDGGYYFSVGEAKSGALSGKIEDREEKYDLYAHAFVIFAFSHYYQATGDEDAKKRARRTLRFIADHFAIVGVPGLVEALDAELKPLDEVRRHESHMHFLEACLFAYDVWQDKAYLDMAERLVMLFTDYFYDAHHNTLSEYFTGNLDKPYKEDGQIICEPGHYYEWIWLLKKYETTCIYLLEAADGGSESQKSKEYQRNKRIDEICLALLDWANANGWDKTYGGIYDELTPNGEFIKETKRLWPFSEAIKANALMLDCGVDKDDVKALYREMVDVFNKNYMQERGFWTEWLTRDLRAATDYMPGTTPYHVYFGIMEALDVLQARGRSKSLRAGAALKAYGIRQTLSISVRNIRKRLKRK